MSAVDAVDVSGGGAGDAFGQCAAAAAAAADLAAAAGGGAEPDEGRGGGGTVAAVGWASTVLARGRHLRVVGWRAAAVLCAAPVVAVAAAWNRLAWVEHDDAAAVTTLVVVPAWHEVPAAGPAHQHRFPLPAAATSKRGARG